MAWSAMGNLSTPKTVQKLQKALHAKAKAEAGYRFYALYDKISREDILVHACAQCRSNKGARTLRRMASNGGLANWRSDDGGKFPPAAYEIVPLVAQDSGQPHLFPKTGTFA
jgi:hypothetical protein